MSRGVAVSREKREKRKVTGSRRAPNRRGGAGGEKNFRSATEKRKRGMKGSATSSGMRTS